MCLTYPDNVDLITLAEKQNFMILYLVKNARLIQYMF